MDKADQLQGVLSRGERLLARKSYAAAKKEFDKALRIAPDVDVREKVRICEERIALDRRGDRIKKARRLEKKGDFTGALDCFTAAFETQAEPWLEDKIAQLHRRVEADRAELAVEKASGEKDPSIRLAAYDRALAQGSGSVVPEEILEKKAGCLVELGRYEEAVALYADEAPARSIPRSVQGRYDFGYALIARGRYLEGLAQWEPLLPDYPALFPQIIALLPYLTRELAERDRDYALPRRVLAIIAEALSLETPPATAPDRPSPDRQLIEQYVRYFDYCYLKELWYAGDHREIPKLLPASPRLRDAPLLARLYFSLSETDIDHLGAAITYWLTAIYNRDILCALHSHQAAAGTSGNVPGDETLRGGLLGLLEKQLTAHDRAGRLTPSLKAHWQMEHQGIARLAALPLEEVPAGWFPSPEDGRDRSGSPSGDTPVDGHGIYFPCTPAFAREFGISDKILTLLREKKDSLTLDERDWLELHAGYSPLGQYLDWIEPGGEEKIFSALPGKTSDPETDYLRQRIAFRCGINRVRAGGRQSRKYFQAAIPLLQTSPDLRRELIDLVHGEASEKVISSLSEVMEFLSRHLDDPSFLEAAAHCIGLDVENLVGQGVSPNAVQKRLDAGLAICPDSPRIQTTLQFVRREKNFRRVDKAFKARNLSKAARIVVDTGDEALEGLFFDAMQNAYQQLLFTAKDERMVMIGLRELYEACCIVDEEHGLTWQLEEALSEREGL